MIDLSLLYLILLLFLTILNIIGYLKAPILMLLVMVFSMILIVPSFEAFGDAKIVPLLLILLNVVFSAIGLVRTVRK